ncbi:MAG: hypothetical protein QM662_04220 [Gordonia sp. (in: high G+C Gram-positive bacteria)]
MTHFDDGIHVDLDSFDGRSGNTLALTTLDGAGDRPRCLVVKESKNDRSTANWI